ncbi:MAG: proteasome accessory factor PafA2 family protein [Planctomycetes bacterium]|nr:proteasome accessory factor PafA2 family protein [Planctomycetota bacterium]
MHKRIYGLETEVVIQFSPAVPGGPAPTRREIFDLLEDLLAARYRWLRSRQSKKGIFLENGALFHYEAQVHLFSQGLVEVSTPECTDPWEAARYHAACQRILVEALPELRERLADRGFAGELSFTQNATDKPGTYYGSHENYYVEDPTRGLRAVALWLCFPFFLAVYGVLFCAIFLPFILFLLGLLAGMAIYFPVSLCRYLPVVGRLFARVAGGFEWLGRALSRLDQDVILCYWGAYSKYLLYPFVTVYSAFLRGVAFVRVRRDLTSFLVTRTLLTGAGAFGFAGSPSGFRLSQKAAAIRRVCRIFWDDAQRPIFDVKTFLREPCAVLRARKRLHILYSDSNMSETAVYLKLGLTGLVLEMIEAGVDFGVVRLADPVAALHALNDDPTLCTRHTLTSGAEMTGLEIQRFYLAKARDFFVAPDARSADLLRRWAACLDALEENPRLLYPELDWVAKLDLVDEALGERAAWRKLAAVHSLLEEAAGRADLGALAGSSDAAILRATAAALGLPASDTAAVAARLARAGVTPAELPRLAIGYWSAHKIDLRYHELDAELGYHYQLAAGGQMARLFTDAEVATAMREPPASTRAAVRASVIRFCRERDVEATLDWDRAVLVGPPRRRLRFADPFQTQIELR